MQRTFTSTKTSCLGCAEGIRVAKRLPYDRQMFAATAAQIRLCDTARLRLRPLVEDDAAFILELLNDRAWLHFIGDRNVSSLDAAAAYVRDGPAASVAKNGFGLWRVSLKGDDTPIGLCGLLQRDALTDPDIGFAFLERFRGHGYALEAATATLAVAQNSLGLTRLLAITRPDNHASIALLTRLGMSLVGQVALHAATVGDCLFAMDLKRERP